MWRFIQFIEELSMKQKSIAVAYPTIPIIFLGGINPDRTPIYDTMGLAVTSEDEITRTETVIELILDENVPKDIDVPYVKFMLNGKEITGLRGEQIIKAIKSFMTQCKKQANLLINSTNYNIFSGSSDSGLAALFTALNDLLELGLSTKQLLEYSMRGSESAGRSLYGGLTHTIANTSPIKVIQLASEKELSAIKLFSVPFHFESRITADEIHAGIVTHNEFDKRKKNIPIWVNRIQQALKANNIQALLETAEENIRNAHELLEGVGLVVRKPEMMNLCNDIHQMRKDGIPAYFLIGGGNLITIATLKNYADQVAKKLDELKWTYYHFKVGSAPKIVSNE